jgi:cyclic dehypoxanthinyl futalosine synthase
MADIPPAGSFDYLKTQAVSRLYLDNFMNIQSSWVTQGLKIGQLALLFGANDMGSLMIEENVVAEAGTVHYLTLDEIRAAIEELGYTPRQRNVFYQLFDQPHEQRAIAANRARYEQIRTVKPAVTSGSRVARAMSMEPVQIAPLSIVSGDGTA